MKSYKELNYELKENLTREVIGHACRMFGDGLVMSSSLGRYSAVMLHLATSEVPGIPVINIRLRDETERTKRHREELRERFVLNLKVFDVWDDKAQTLRHALQTLDVRALLSGVLWGETKNRAGFEYFMDDRSFNVQRVYPLLHWKEGDLIHHIRRNGLPENEDYVDSFKECSEQKECGLHLFQDGGGI